ncbi:MAG TPA: phosphatase PAP2 family protein [Methylomirabilota bacterium]|nr:phosphatase PAP2 family protein [Methylomirabilota bacterium]
MDRDLLHLGCSLLKIPAVYDAMGALGYFGHGLLAVPLGLGLIAAGYARQNQRFKQAGFAVLVSIAAAGLLTETLKQVFQISRPRSYGSYGFPSGHSGTAFALASSLSISFPGFTPLYFLLATMTAISRLYFRAHYLIDVLAGGILGGSAGALITRKIVAPPIAPRGWSFFRGVGWLTVGAAALFAVAFFRIVETRVGSYRTSEAANPSIPREMISFDFGTPSLRAALRSGWSADELWNEGKQSVVWAEGLRARMVAAFPAAAAYRWRLNLFPYAGRGPACQVMEVIVNKASVVKMLLEQGWHWYEFDIPKGVIQSGDNEVEFVFSFSESPQSRGRGPDPRHLSVAFDLLQATAQSQ